DVLDGVGLLTERDRERREADGAAAELLDDRAEELAVEALEPRLVDLEQLERLLRDLARDGTGVPHLRHVAHAAQDPVRDSGRSTGAARDLLRGRVLDLDAEDASAPCAYRSSRNVSPKRSRSGVVRRPVRVVAPTSVNGGRSSVSVRAAGPWPTTMSSRKSSSAG